MERHRTMSTYFWTDEYIESCSPHEKLVYVYLCFNQMDNNAGIYQISRGTIAGHTGLPVPEVADILDKFQTDGKIMYKDNTIAIKNKIKNQNIQNYPIRQNILLCLKNAPKWAVDFVDTSSLYQTQEAHRGPLEVPSSSHQGDTGALSKSKSKSSSTINAYRVFLNMYKMYRKTDYVTTNEGKDSRLLKLIFQQVGDDYTDILRLYHKSTDIFVIQNGFNVTCLNTRLSGLLLDLKTEKQKKQDESKASMLEKSAKASQRIKEEQNG